MDACKTTFHGAAGKSAEWGSCADLERPVSEVHDFRKFSGKRNDNAVIPFVRDKQVRAVP